MKQRRIDQGYSIDEAAQASGVPQRHIKLLEAEQVERLPSFLYVKAFLSRYCQFLSVDCDPVTLAYEKLFERIKPTPPRPPSAIKIKKTKITPRRISLISIIALFVVLGGFALWQSSFILKPPELTITQPGLEQQTTLDNILVSGLTDPQATVTLNGEQIFVDNNGTFQETVLLNEGINTLTIISSSRFGKQKTRTVRVTYRP